VAFVRAQALEAWDYLLGFPRGNGSIASSVAQFSLLFTPARHFPALVASGVYMGVNTGAFASVLAL
jgi:hypothetical protein